MYNFDERYYNGYEGEGEMIFIIRKNGIERRRIGIWDGYFSDMIELFEPKEYGWEGLPLFYHAYSFDCYDEDTAWHAEDLDLIYSQLESINPDMIRFYDTPQVIAYLMAFFKEAMDNNEDVYIYEE